MIGSMVVALLLAVCIIANIALNRYADTITYYWNLEATISGGNDEQTAALKAQAWQAAKDVTLETADEGVTLLKNENGQLPMTETKLNVFGYASVSLVYGGAGSGSTSGAIYCENMKESFEAQDFEVNEDLWNYYSGVSEGIDSGEWDVFAAGGTDFNFYDAACGDVADYIDGAKAFSDTAVVVLSRTGGEGTDLPLDVEASGRYGGDADKHYLELQSCEEELLELVCGSPYRRVTYMPRGQKRYVWRCINRLEHGTRVCRCSATMEEPEFQAAVACAINERFRQQSARQTLTDCVTAALAGSGDADLSLPAAEVRLRALQERQMELLQIAAGDADSTAILFGDVIVRQVIGSIGVLDRERLSICFKDGTQVEQTIEYPQRRVSA